MEVNIQIIARMHSDFATKFGIPRQSGLVEELRSTIVFEPEFRNPDALRGIEDFSHLWIIWQFSEAVRQGIGIAELRLEDDGGAQLLHKTALAGNAEFGGKITVHPGDNLNVYFHIMPSLSANRR